MGILKLLLASFITITSLSLAQARDLKTPPVMSINIIKWDEESLTVKLIGPTTEFRRLLLIDVFAEHNVSTIVMYGPGGNFYTGLLIGEMIREEGATVIIPNGKECISACAFSALGASKLIVEGDLLFHRPYRTNISTFVPIEEVMAEGGRVYLDMAYYIMDMGYSFYFAKSLIWDTSPCKFIKIQDLSKLRVDILKQPDVKFSYDDKCKE